MSVNKQISKYRQDIKLIKLQTCVIRLLGILRFLFNYEDHYRKRKNIFEIKKKFFFFINYDFFIFFLKQKDIFSVSLQCNGKQVRFVDHE